MSEFQNGFRKNRCDPYHSFSMMGACRIMRNRGLTPRIFMLDFSKAFDMCPFKILFNRLRSIGIPPDMMSCIRDLYSKINIKVKVNGCVSDTFRIKAGILQSDPLSPLLFAIFINHMIKAVAASRSCSSIADTKCAFAYADDFACIADSDEGIQELINISKKF